MPIPSPAECYEWALRRKMTAREVSYVSREIGLINTISLSVAHKIVMGYGGVNPCTLCKFKVLMKNPGRVRELLKRYRGGDR